MPKHLYIFAVQYIIMKNIKIRLNVKKELDAFGNGLSVNKTMRKLLENAETHEQQEEEPVRTININMDDELLDKLKQCKISPSESHSDTIARLLKEYKDSHQSDD